jgi:hypothetical protein
MVASLLSETNPGDDLLPFLLPVLSQEGWDGTELSPATYVHHLSSLEIASVNSAIKHFECRLPPGQPLVVFVLAGGITKIFNRC